jgi:ABC-type polysaccharide/polyol phosphate transport system ATPase subunit
MVNHAAEVIREFCGRALLLHRGALLADGAPDAVVDRYHAMAD